MGMTSPFPEPDSPELERFQIYAALEILAELQRLCTHQVLLTAYFPGTTECVVTRLLAVHPEKAELIFDAACDAAAQTRVTTSPLLVMVGFHDQVKVQFAAHAAHATMHAGKPAFATRMPPDLLRLQRRNFFRVPLPSDQPATCLMPLPNAPNQYESLQVLDLSLGGMAIMSYPRTFDWPNDERVSPCYLDLPQVGQLAVRMRVRRIEPNHDTPSVQRLGCEFIDMPEHAMVMLQRYMNKVDAARRQKLAPKVSAA
jgi:c-di-GMP-binding flagellar brake protein YcgR